VKLAVAVAGCSRNQPHGIHHTLVDPRQLASDARMRTIYVSVGLLRGRHREVPGSNTWGLESFPGPSFQSPRSLEVRERPASFRFVSHLVLVRFNTCCAVSVPRVFAACCGTGRMLHLACGVCAVLRTGCRVQCFAHAAACPLPPARRTRYAAVPCVSMLQLACARVLLHAVCCLIHVVCCMRRLALPSSARWLLHAACCLVSCCLVACCQWSFHRFHVVCCMLHVACCTLPVACCTLPVACCMLRCMTLLPAACCSKSGACCPLRVASRLLFAAHCLLHGACCLDVVCCTRVVGYIFPDACCMLSSVVRCTFSSGRLRHCCPLDRVCVPFLCCTSHVLRCMVAAACCPSPQCPPAAWCALPIACPTSHLVTVHVLRCASSVACCRPHVPLPHAVAWMLPVPSCTSSAACRLLPVAECHSAVTRAAHRGGART
jgi:hypothetical protein